MSHLDKPLEGLDHVSGQNMLPLGVPQGGGNLALCGSGSPPTNQEFLKHDGGSSQSEDVNTMHQESADLDLAAGGSDTPLTNHQDGPLECPQHASGQCEDEDTMDQQVSGRDVAACESDIPPMSQLDKPLEGLDHVSSQRKDKNSMPQQSLDPVVAGYDNGPVGGQRKDIFKETGGKKRSREEDENGESTVVDHDGCLTSLATSTLAGGNGSEQENLGLLYNLEDHSHGLGEISLLARRNHGHTGCAMVKAASADQILHLVSSP
uniref:Uncharacterized protein n=1 Tax=Setaria viridis TaxID=4556 RepID=A0A4U6U006_SETVI|nr:hypothetical protein SEVIR_6G042400v2 [Setaria viridis]